MTEVGDYHKRGNWALWLGVEVEGALVGAPTLFVGDATPQQIFIAFRDYRDRFTHVFFNPIYIEKHGLLMPMLAQASKCDVTLSLTPEQYVRLQPSQLLHFHIMLTVDLSVYAVSLKPNDSVKLQFGRMSEGGFDNWSVPVRDGFSREAADYTGDTPIAYLETVHVKP